MRRLRAAAREPAASGLIALDEKRRSVIQSLQDMQSRRNAASKEIGAAMAQKNMELAEKLKAEVADLKDNMPRAEEEDRQVTAELERRAVAPSQHAFRRCARRQGRA